MSNENSPPELVQRLETTYQQINATTGGRLGIVRQAVDGFGAARGSQAAASMAYYTLLSLFPLLLVLTITMSLFVDIASAQTLILTVLDEILPEAATFNQFIVDIVDGVVASRTEVGIISVVTLIWSASGAFTTLTYNIDLAWAHQRPPSSIKARLVGLLMIGIIYALLLAALIATPILTALSSRPTPLLDALGLDLGWLWSWTPRIVAMVVTLVALLAIYRWVPKPRVPWRAAFWAALLSMLALQALNLGFGWYLGSGMARYELIYGSVTTIIVLLLWIYFSVTIIFMGAHLCASISRRMNGGLGQPSHHVVEGD